MTKRGRRFVVPFADESRLRLPSVSVLEATSDLLALKIDVFDREPLEDGIIRMELGGDAIGRRWFSVPVFDDPQQMFSSLVAIRLSDSLELQSLAAVTTQPASSRAASILSFLEDTATDDALSLWQEARMDDEAEETLRVKLSDPFAAAAAGVFLATRGGAARMHDWVRNLARWFDKLPDGAVLWAYQLLTDPDLPSRVRDWRNTWPEPRPHRVTFASQSDAAWAWALEAERRGPPVYAQAERLQDEVVDRLLRSSDIAKSGLLERHRAEFMNRIMRRRKRRQAIWRCGVVSGGFGTILEPAVNEEAGNDDRVPEGAFQIDRLSSQPG